MNALYKNENSILGLSPLDIQNGRDSGLTKLTDEESVNWLTGNYEIIDGVISEKAPVELSLEEQAAALESTITTRNYQAALIGDEVALAKIADVQAAISALGIRSEVI